MNKKTIKSISQEIRNGKKVVEVVEESLQAIKRDNEKLNIFLTVCEKEALREALMIDKEIEKDKSILERKPLLGVPLAHKDMFMTKGIVSTAGSKVLDGYIPPYSATVVEKLEDAGAITIGKVNQDAWAHGASGENSDYGATKNPLNNEYVPGGSSSGSASAVAAGMVPLATGTDTGGSIRQPASFCGVVGVKPTYGRVSRFGVTAMASSLDCIGHLTNTVEDAALVLSVTAGKDLKDATSFSSKPFDKDCINNKISGMKVGLPKEYVDPIKNAEIKKNLDEMIGKLESLGVEVVEVSLPNTALAIETYYVIQPAEVSSNLARYQGIRYGNDRNSFGEEAKRRILLGTFTLSAGYYDAYYKKALQVRTLIKNDFDMVFEKVDALITPVSPTLPFKLGEKSNDPVEMYLSDILTVGPSLAGVPGIAIPTGKNKDGLPFGIQIIANQHREEIAFPVAHQLFKSIWEI